MCGPVRASSSAGWTDVITVRNPTPAEWRDWDLVVARFPNTRIVHQRAWIEWLEACGCGSPLCLIVERDGEIIGASPGLLARMGPLRLYGSPLPGWQTPMMGPVFDPERVGARELILALLSFLERRHGVHHVELLSDSLDGSAMRHLGFRAETVPTYRARLYPGEFRPYLDAASMDVASVDVIRNGFHQAKKIADLAETYEVNCAPHNYYSHLATFISAQWCAAIPNVRILEVDVDDVPWREELTTAVPEIAHGALRIPSGPGWGADVNEEVLREHPWPAA